MTRSRLQLIVLLSLGGVFLLSLALELFLPHRQARVELQFPYEIERGLGWEVRTIPFSWSTEKNVEETVKEILLGPAFPDRLRLFSRDAALRDIYFQGSTIIVDLALTTLRPDGDVETPPLQALKIMSQDILFNFPWYKKVEFAIQGTPVLDKIR